MIYQFYNALEGCPQSDNHYMTNQVTQTVRYECSKCDSLFTSRIYLHQHEATSHNRIFHCPFCSALFSNKADFKIHVTAHSEKRYLPCSFCKKVFFDVDEYNTHVKMHREPFLYNCDNCPAMFSQLSSLRTHNSVHLNKKFVHTITKISKRLVRSKMKRLAKAKSKKNLISNSVSHSDAITDPLTAAVPPPVAILSPVPLASGRTSPQSSTTEVTSQTVVVSDYSPVLEPSNSSAAALPLLASVSVTSSSQLAPKKKLVAAKHKQIPVTSDSNAPKILSPSGSRKTKRTSLLRTKFNDHIENMSITSLSSVPLPNVTNSITQSNENQIASITQQPFLDNRAKKKTCQLDLATNNAVRTAEKKNKGRPRKLNLASGTTKTAKTAEKKKRGRPCKLNLATGTIKATRIAEKRKQGSSPKLRAGTNNTAKKRKHDYNPTSNIEETFESTSSRILATVTSTSNSEVPSSNTVSTTSQCFTVEDSRKERKTYYLRSSHLAVKNNTCNCPPGKISEISNYQATRANDNVSNNSNNNINITQKQLPSRTGKSKSNDSLEHRSTLTNLFLKTTISPTRKSYRKTSFVAFYMCASCNRIFPNNRMLDKHMLLHYQNRGFRCGICGGLFGGQGNLFTHQRSGICLTMVSEHQ